MSNTARAHGPTHQLATRLLLLIVAFLPIIANGIIALIAVDQLRVAHREVENTLGVVQALKQLDDLLDTSSRDRNGYSVFADPALLAAYRVKQAAIAGTLQYVRDLIAIGGGNPTDLDKIGALIDQDTAASASLEGRSEPLPLSAGKPSELKASEARGDEIMAAINDLLADQRQLLDKRLKVIASRNTVAFITILLGTGGGIALVGVIFYLMRRDLRSTSKWRKYVRGRCRRANSASAASSRRALSASCSGSPTAGSLKPTRRSAECLAAAQTSSSATP